MPGTIIILTGAHLCHNPRVIKEATTFANAGYSVEVLGAWFDPILTQRDLDLLKQFPFKYTPVIDFNSKRISIFISQLWFRLVTKLGKLIYKYLCIENKWQLGPVIAPLGKTARQRQGDIYIAHSEVAMVVAKELAESGRKVAVDMEDWFSEDLLPEQRKYRPIRLIKNIEKYLLQHGCYSSCPSAVMSKALSTAYQCDAPLVIYNAFPWKERELLDNKNKDRRNLAIPSIHWYSQTIGKGRGLEDLFSALKYVEQKMEIHLRGKCDDETRLWLLSLAPVEWQDMIYFHELVSNEELLSRICEHDIGFSGELASIPNRKLTITNKIFHYFLGGLAVIASDTDGNREIAHQSEEAILLYASGNSRSLASHINQLLKHQEMLKLMKSRSLISAEKHYCWEKQENIILDKLSGILSGI